MEAGKKGILVVSFGTTHRDTREKTIERIEKEIAVQYPEYRIYRAWTSGMIRAVCLKRDQEKIDSTAEALDRMAEDGILDVLIQPTHVINGDEYEKMVRMVESKKDRFDHVTIGSALLTTSEDLERAVCAVAAELSPNQDEALVLMGHGTEHFADTVYAAMDYRFKDLGHPNIFMGTVEGYPTLDSVRKMLKRTEYRKILLSPFMIVAGDHAKNDLSGEEEDSWKNILCADGYEVRCVLKGLGEFPQIRKMILDHIAEKLS